jgi:prepilin-type N-terminal cleavage/methylation domain-containing protein
MTKRATGTEHGRCSGFTLIEVLLAVAVSSIVMFAVGMTFTAMLEARAEVEELSESTDAGPRILSMLERDLSHLWTYDVKKNAVLVGRNRDINSFEADRIDMLTTTDSIGYVVDSINRQHHVHLCEVGYWLKQNPRYRDLMELWRREDPLQDNDLLTDGRFQLVHDRIKSFKLTYYRSLGFEAEELNEWDSSVDDSLPRRIKIEFTVERKRGNRNVVDDAEFDDFEGAEKTYVRHIVFDTRMMDALKAGTAMIPLKPPPPEDPQGHGGGPAGPAGRGGRGSRGALNPSAISETGGEPAPKGSRGRGNGQGGEGGRGNGSPQPGGPGAGGRPQLPPGFNLGDMLRGGGNGGNFGGLFGGGR